MTQRPTFRSIDKAGRYPIVCHRPAPNFFHGALLGNGGMGGKLPAMQYADAKSRHTHGAQFPRTQSHSDTATAIRRVPHQQRLISSHRA
jgi:hypothetical protein